MEVPPTPLCLPASLPFPLTIHRLHSSPSSQVNKTQQILTYSYLQAKPNEQGKRERQVESWDSPVEGQLVKWDIKEGQILQDSSKPIVHIREPCTHDVQWDGMCAVCGKDLTAVDYTGFSDTARATISMVHDVGGLTVSLSEAHRLESATTRRLLSSKKLSLIVDLDQTIVHATVDPTVGEWLKDEKNPNFGALKGVGKFKLGDEVGVKKRKRKATKEKRVDEKGKSTETPGGNGGSEPGLEATVDATQLEEDGDEEEEEEEDGCWYYIKMRPGLADFLSRISQIYEMHVYTMGTRAYAIEVCKVIDPTGALFGGRILSRDESGSMTRKSLQRLFPCDTNMVVIIDDRADVWDGSPNLVKVIPYEFFVGIGDINAAFLPKKKELVPPPTTDNSSSTSAPSPGSDASSSTAESSVSNGSEEGGRERITTTPPTSPEEEKASLPPVTHEPPTVNDLLVTPSPTSIVSPSLSDASASQAHDIELQMADRPLQRAADQSHLLHLQHQHERSGNSKSPSPAGDLKVDESEMPAEANGEGDTTVDETMEEELAEDEEDEAVLKDDDTELDRVFDILSNVHKTFYKEHDQAGASDVATIIPSMKRSTLARSYLVFSGLVALGTRPEDSEYWKLAETFGAKCGNDLREGVTHLVANQPGTAKVHSARRNPRIKIVYPQWLLDSVAHWTRLSEDPYLLPEPKPASTLSTPQEPRSPVRPELSDGEGDNEDLEDEAGAADLDMGEIDWGEAMAEMDDLLNETDDDATDRDEEGESSSTKGKSSKKRGRVSSTTNTDDESDGGGGGGSKKKNGTSTESPLQKRVKTARSRSSGLKTSLSAAALAAAAAADSESGSVPPAPSTSTRNPQDSIDAAIGRAESAEMSQASSSISSDDEGFLASLEAELEAGFEEGEGEGGDEDEDEE